MLVDRFGKRGRVLVLLPVFVLVPGLDLVATVGVVAAADNTALSAALSFSSTTPFATASTATLLRCLRAVGGMVPGRAAVTATISRLSGSFALATFAA